MDVTSTVSQPSDQLSPYSIPLASSGMSYPKSPDCTGGMNQSACSSSGLTPPNQCQYGSLAGALSSTFTDSCTMRTDNDALIRENPQLYYPPLRQTDFCGVTRSTNSAFLPNGGLSLGIEPSEINASVNSPSAMTSLQTACRLQATGNHLPNTFPDYLQLRQTSHMSSTPAYGDFKNGSIGQGRSLPPCPYIQSEPGSYLNTGMSMVNFHGN